MIRHADAAEALGGGLALVVAGIHLQWGIPRFVAYASVGVMPDPRPLAFVLSGHAILLAVTLVLLGAVDGRRLYVPGIVLMALHLVGYAAWHTVLAHGGAGTESHTHVPIGLGGVASVVLEHVWNSPLALVSKTSELVVLSLLVGLYVWGAEDGDDP